MMPVYIHVVVGSIAVKDSGFPDYLAKADNRHYVWMVMVPHHGPRRLRNWQANPKWTIP
jgi:hypothetical protein